MSFCLSVLIASTLFSLEGDVTRFYVALSGNDAWTGKLEKPATDGSDGPFASLERARTVIRELPPDERQLPIEVVVRAGNYPLAKCLELEAQDSGSEQARITYRAAFGEKVILSGGRELTKWLPIDDPEVRNRLAPEARDAVVWCSLDELGITDLGDATEAHRRPELFWNGTPLTLARWPNEGFAKIDTLTGTDPIDSHGLKGDKLGRFTIAEDRVTRWVGESDLRVHGYWFWDWSDAYAPVASVDASKRELVLGGTPHHYGYRAGQRFYVLNAISELDSPGEWYLDRERKRIYLWPPQPIEGNRVVLSVAPALVKGADVSWVTFRHFTLEACRSSAMTFAGGTGVEILGCQLVDIGGAGISMSGDGHAVRGCDLAEIGESGISISGGDRETLQPGRGEVENNWIHHYARLQKTYAPAIGIGGVGHRVANNVIHDGPHCGILLSGNDHLLEMNEIHHVCQETGDVGAFYMGRDWSMRGNVLRHNYFHHIRGPGLHGAMAVYLDDAASGTQIYGNVFHKAGRAAFIGGGRDNHVINNVFVDCEPSVHVDARGLGWMRNHIEEDMPERLKALPYQSPPWSDRYPALVTIFDGDPGAPTGNVVARNISVGGRWEDIEAAARPLVHHEANLVDVDPHFVDAAKGNFQLRDDSPAYKLGFERIPFERIGLIPDAHRATWRTGP